MDYKNLALRSLRFTDDERCVTFPVDTFQVKYDMRARTVEVKGQKQAAAEAKAAEAKRKKKDAPAAKTEKPKRSRAVGNYSPDGAYCAYVRGHDLYLFRESDQKSVRLTEDGETDYSFASEYSAAKPDKESAPEVNWVDGSRYFVVTRTDKRKVGTIPYMRWHGKRPTVEEEKFVMPGDKHVPQTEVYICRTDSMTMKRVEVEKWKDQKVELYTVGDKSRVFFLRKRRTCDEMEFCRIEPDGSVKVLINEVCKPYINDMMFSVRLSRTGDEIYWWSERTGYGHYYRYDGEGNLLNAITEGDWTAGSVARIDTLRGEMYFYAFGQVKGEPPYYQRLNKARLDGRGGVELLTPEMGTHKVTLLKDGYIVDNYSRADLAPRTVLRDPKGRVMMELGRADMSKLLEMGWRYPEPIQVKAADGRTDLYGFMWKPFDFDSTQTYPIISQVYPGPFTETVWTDFTVFDKYNNTALAQRGFIVVCMGHRGGSPYRDKAYATYGYGNLRDYPLADDICGIRQLGRRFSFIDTTRVGIVGHSGGGMMAVAAICTYPDFYKVAVASSGNHDNRIYNRTWGETYQGIGDDNRFHVDLNQDLVGNLKGRLLLVTGEVDQNVHPAQTLRLVNALILKNKDFDMLILPNQGHHYEGPYGTYFEKKKRDYFTRYLK